MNPIEAFETIKKITSTREQGCDTQLRDDYIYREEVKAVEEALQENIILRYWLRGTYFFIEKGKFTAQQLTISIKVLEILKTCFTLSGFDELIPNSKWYDNKNNEQEVLRGIFNDKEK